MQTDLVDFKICYDLQLKYKSGKDLHRADIPFRGFNGTEAVQTHEYDVHVKIIKKFLPSQAECHCTDLPLQKAKILDKTLQEVIQTMYLSDWAALVGP